MVIKCYCWNFFLTKWQCGSTLSFCEFILKTKWRGCHTQTLQVLLSGEYSFLDNVGTFWQKGVLSLHKSQTLCRLPSQLQTFQRDARAIPERKCSALVSASVEKNLNAAHRLMTDRLYKRVKRIQGSQCTSRLGTKNIHGFKGTCVFECLDGRDGKVNLVL